LTTDLAKVRKAASIIYREYILSNQYGTDANKYYRSPYGVFVAHVSTCAGGTRALGRVLDFMGYDWTHANPNSWTHQWCVLQMDGKTAKLNVEYFLNLVFKIFQGIIVAKVI